MRDDGEVQGPSNTRFSLIEVVEETGSTNKDLLDAASRGAPEGRVLVTGHQTAGRGRQGRSWHDDPGSSLLCSVLLRPDPSWAPLIPLATGLAVVAGIEVATGVVAHLKWPNDVLVSVPKVGDRKLCGILAEAAGSGVPGASGGADGFVVVVGFGMNLRWTTVLPDEVAARSIDLASLTEASVERMHILLPTLTALETRLRQLERGLIDELLDDYRGRCSSIGRMVRFETPRGELYGEVTGIDVSGGLVLVTSDGIRHVLTSGEAHHVTL